MAKPNNERYLTTIAWGNEGVTLIDQTKLPESLEYITCKNYMDVADAIKKLAIRGAPAIGVAAAMGLALCANNSTCTNKAKMMEELQIAYNVLLKTRPTAVNLKWGLDRVLEEAKKYDEVDDIRKHTILQAIKMFHDDVKTNRMLGQFGSDLISDGEVVMTHCNAGALATVSYGTALGVIRSVMESGKKISVIATETRPVMQGSRLTAFELVHDGIDVSLIPDTAVGYLMSNKMVDKVVVGADRILRSGHVFNKIGTYQVALLSKAHNIPFYVAAPLSTFDMDNEEKDIDIEERSVEEVVKIGEKRIAPAGVRIFNPAFDVTSPELITGIITEKGVIYPPYETNLKPLFESDK
ncbi:MAG TPA: S-methyl-5-thioribose-1-phosphate isomerase [Candidatus Nitrosocosmicus sp.]|nr:S-methyl-5-thioribose-1-phosphate isomerase [Candidatus Nitrosocosmicus sp.]